MLPGPRLFRSRWTAVLWGAGMLWFAYDVADFGGPKNAAPGAAATDATSIPVDDSDARNTIHALESING
jgi:hypothetical protein